MPRRTILVVTAALAPWLWGCAGIGGGDGPTAECTGGEPADGHPLRIATTVAPVTSIVANIAGGSGAVVTGLVPEGVNSHTYEPAPSVAATLEDADVVFHNGLSLEEPTKEMAQGNMGDDAVLCALVTTILPGD